MRPRKKILLYCEDADHAGILAFALHHSHAGYTVAPCGSALEIANALPLALWDAALLVDAPAHIANAIRMVQPNCRIAAMHNGPGLAWSMLSDISLPALASTKSILDALAVLCARKRGPRKGVPWTPERKERFDAARS